MKRRLLILTGVLACLMTAVPAPAQTLRERLIEQFDKDGDGRLSSEERAAARSRVLPQRDDREPERLVWPIDGLDREALVYLPPQKSDEKAPLVFAFHGHGGSAQQAARSFGYQRLWPEAIIVYMQGIPTPGQLTDPEGKRNGWQHDIGAHDDRDLKFFDAVLKTLLQKHHADLSRIYATGHSNGGGFSYLLWSARGDVFAAIAPSAAGARTLVSHPPKPVPVLHVAGEQDQLVRFSVQQLVMQRVRQINQCAAEGRKWDDECTLYPSEKGAPFVAMIHPGTHTWPSHAAPRIVKFFQEHRSAGNR